MAEDTFDIPEINPVVFDKAQLDAYGAALSTSPGGSTAVIAKQIVGEVQQDAPGLFDYQSLRDGTAKYFTLVPEIKDIPPARRALSDAAIISLFAVDPEGNPIEPGTMGGGFLREIIPQAGSLPGFFYGAKAGASLPIPHPLGKAAAGLAGGVLGALGGYKGGELVAEEILGKERPTTPGQNSAYEMGKTAAGAVAYLPLPFMISKNVNLGTAEFLANMAKAEGKTPRSIRFVQGIENTLSRTGTAARAAPLEAITLDLISGAGQTVGAGFAEEYFPGDPAARILSEITGGVSALVVGAPTTTMLINAPKLRDLQKRIKDRGYIQSTKDIVGGLKTKRQTQAVNRILEILEAEQLREADYRNVATDAISAARASGIVDEAQLAKIGEKAEKDFVKQGIDKIIENLSSPQISSMLVDESGKPIPLTAGAKGGSPALLAIEQSVDQLSGQLKGIREKGAAASIKALRNLILAMAQTGDQEALQTAGDMAERLFSASIQDNMNRVTDNVLQAWKKVGGDGVKSNIRLSETLYDVITRQLENARIKEQRLWNGVPTVTVPVDTSNPPSFLSYWDNLDSMTKEAREEYLKVLGPLNKFVKRKELELGFATDAKGNLIPATDDLTTKELSDMRSLALGLGKKLSAAGDSQSARIAFETADALLEDLQSVAELGGGEAFQFAYNTARAYSKALNDTFTRSFAGETQATVKTGAERLAPELLSKRLLQGGNDPTYLRLKEINEVGSFAQREGLEGADQTVGTLLGTTEQILRNARASAFDPETGTINPDRLAVWMEQNKEVLDIFPSLRKDLSDARTANILLDEQSKLGQKRIAEERAQLSFYDLMNPVISPDGRRMFGTESPTTAIARALAPANKTKARSLGRLLDVVNRVDDPALKEQAMTGLKSAIIEWGATKAGITGGSFSPKTAYESFFLTPLSGTKGPSLMDWMLSNRVINESEATNMKTYLQQMVKFEAAEVAGEIGEVVEKAGPILDFYLAITGSAIGTKAQSILTGGRSGPGALIAAGRGAETMRRLFADLPVTMQTDVMSELMANPELLAAMMRKPRNEKEKLRVAERVKTLLADLGIRPVIREVPAVPREIMRPGYDIPLSDEDETAPAPVPPPPAALPPVTIPQQRSSLAPVAPVPTRAAPAPAPSTVQPPPAAPGPTPSGPVDRARFLQAFPTGPAADLAREQATQQGIGSLMGG